jgi:flavin reductase (DIM6/NTAB) family NADH-FMN oxidoreductase RutF
MPLDPAVKKKALRMLSYGLCIVTSREESGPAAGTITWISQSSFTPPLVMAAIKDGSGLRRAVAASRVFAVHIVGKSQQAMATAFFKGAQPSDGMLNGYRVEAGETGSPLLADAIAWLECRVVNEVTGGDHIIFVGEVLSAGVRSEEEPLSLRDTGFSYGG